MQTLNPFFAIFIFKNDMQEQETITSNRYRYRWKVLALGVTVSAVPHLSLGTALTVLLQTGKFNLHCLLVKDSVLE